MNNLSLTKAILALLLIFAFSSCTLTKRRYNRGFHIDWIAGSHPQTKSRPPSGTSTAAATWLTTLPECDTIIRKNGDTLLSARTTLTNDHVLVIQCNDDDSTFLVLDTTTVKQIQFESGGIRRFKNERPPKEPAPTLIALPIITSAMGVASYPAYFSPNSTIFLMFTFIFITSLISLLLAYQSKHKGVIRWAWFAVIIAALPLLVFTGFMVWLSLVITSSL
ncbi:MAG: hypothetical protein H6608_05500 [Flavobacteriales bacterium]|nr:hypothetical protein [Flavobacteriales bacterium]